jgi:mannose-1-phosphate guanylyltransferase
MKALFLAGDTEKKLKPLTDNIPKSMIPIMNKPLLERSFANLRQYGITDIVISTSQKPKYIKEFFGNGERFGLKIDYVSKDASYRTGGAAGNATMAYEDTFLVINADILCNLDFEELIKYHTEKNALVTMATVLIKRPTSRGFLECSDDGYALSYNENPESNQISGYTNAGVYVFEPKLLKEIMANRPIAAESEIFPMILRKEKNVAVFSNCTYWMDIDSPEKYLQTHNDITSGAFKISGVHFDKDYIFKDGKSSINSTAIIKGPVYIGDNVKIGAYTTIGPNAVLGDDVCVHMGGMVKDSVLWNNVDVGGCAKVFGTVIASECRVASKIVHNNSAYTKNKSVNW